MASLQEIVGQLALLATDGTKNSDATPTTPAQHGPLAFITSILKMLLSASALRDWAILLVIGSFFQVARRSLSASWYALIDSFFITAVFDDDDDSFQWIRYWLSLHPSWKTARNIEISTSNCYIDFNTSRDLWQIVTYIPAVSHQYTLWYKCHRMSVIREIETLNGGPYPTERETLTLRIMTRNHRVLEEIIQEAKQAYTDALEVNITCFALDPNGGTYDRWRQRIPLPKRPLASIILDPGITEFVLGDVKDFLDSKEWYAQRGIPFRRGYLLYGAAGSGKTSLIHIIAGELDLDIYTVSLSSHGLDDTGLSNCISALPERCIVLMEDIDAAFHHGLTRETSGDGDHTPALTSNGVSLSGLLNALDGIGAQEGRVLFATTNKYMSLDPALCRPGRMDLHIEFKLASRSQAKRLFKQFYAPSRSTSASASASTVTTKGTSDTSSGKRENDVDVGEDTHPGDLVDLSEPQSLMQAHPDPSSSRLSPPSSSPLQPLPSSPSANGNPEENNGNPEENQSASERPGSGPVYAGVAHKDRAPTLLGPQIDALATQFALAVPERQLSMASLQGYLMLYKTRPFEAVADVGAWAEKELLKEEEEEEERMVPGSTVMLATHGRDSATLLVTSSSLRAPVNGPTRPCSVQGSRVGEHCMNPPPCPCGRHLVV